MSSKQLDTAAEEKHNLGCERALPETSSTSSSLSSSDVGRKERDKERKTGRDVRTQPVAPGRMCSCGAQRV